MESFDVIVEKAWISYVSNPVEGIKIDCSTGVDSDGFSLEDDVRIISREAVDDLLAADGDLMMELIQRLREDPIDAARWLTSKHEVQAYELIVEACRDKQFPA